MEQLHDDLKANRPNIADSSLKTYISIISNLYKKINNCQIIDDANIKKFFVDNVKEVLKFLKNVDPKKRKTTLASLVILTLDKEKPAKIYREQMIEDNDHVRQNHTDEKTEKQKENWVDWNEVLEIHKQLGKECQPLMDKHQRSTTEFNKCQDYVLLSLYVFQDPRRSEDYTNMYIRDYDKKDPNTNYIDKGHFVFQKYKTSTKDGTQRIPISPKMKALLKKWLTINETPYLLVSPTTGKPITPPLLTKRLNHVFDKKISSSMLRHIFWSNKVDIEDLRKTASNMGHGLNTALNQYAKE
jgi:integrase